MQRSSPTQDRPGCDIFGVPLDASEIATCIWCDEGPATRTVRDERYKGTGAGSTWRVCNSCAERLTRLGAKAAA